jgi:Arf-GAP/GTPase/ANK repeat/PH domain-containing protein 1/3
MTTGTSLIQVRSLDLDEWPPGHLAVMAGLGNQLANSVWEARIVPPYRKPGPDSTRLVSIVPVLPIDTL